MNREGKREVKDSEKIVFENVSKFYGEILGVNRVHLSLAPGITGLVGPNGSGKTTLMNLMTGLIRPSEGTIRVLGAAPDEPDRFFGRLGYCAQFDAFPAGMSGYRFIYAYLRVHGMTHAEADAATWRALDRVGLREVAKRRVAGYSKGMRQRARLAQAISHDPKVLVLDEPLNGLDPMARAEVIELFQDLADEGRHLIVSSHILHEVDVISDQVILLSSGYVVAEGDISGVRTEMEDHPAQILVRCNRPARLASRLFEHEFIDEVGLHKDRAGLEVSTRDADSFYSVLGELVLEENLVVETVSVVDADVRAVYQYLIGHEGEAR